eukprot:TRINITY_DN4290_c0_g2_i1.p1 TRINITY_DN4290_c0_g2~~TRINITY_DN4290_c0_g2_i1.p1  ORF type:complete len:300 (-),score=60.36 TRINITY_DN4290_c0_g2_i1:339-1187(-)
MAAQQDVAGVSPQMAASPSVSSRAEAAAGHTRGFKIAASTVAVLLAFALAGALILPVRRPAHAGVHYMPMSHPVAEAQPEQVMTNKPGSIHYLIRHRVSGHSPTNAPMTAGYKALTEVAQQDIHFVKWLVAVGDTVEVGDPLLVFSMGGRHEDLKASAAGQVKELADVSQGDKLSKGTKLVIVGHPGPAFHLFTSSALALLALLTLLGVIHVVRRQQSYEQVSSQAKSLEEGLPPEAEEVAVDALPLKAEQHGPAAASGLPRVMMAAADASNARMDTEDRMA